VKPRFFATPDEFRAWLEENHETADELLVGFWKKATGKPSMDWAQAVDQALCFGWIDGVRRGRDEESYVNRFTPRRKGSRWSQRNVERVEELTKQGLMKPAGLAAFERRDPDSVYSYESFAANFDPEGEKRFKADRKAWEFFQSQPPGYQRIARYWVMNAKKAETRERRLTKLIEDSAAGRRLAAVTPRSKRQQ
jgi:uncharacterized protein YdeI (YjbR/CyaY-like superfamily)